MNKPMIFVLEQCPYCKKALYSLEELQKEEPYQAMEFEIIEETQQKEIADSYDYYYVPSIFYNGNKLHEGALEKEELKAVLDAILSSNE